MKPSLLSKLFKLIVSLSLLLGGACIVRADLIDPHAQSVLPQRTSVIRNGQGFSSESFDATITVTDAAGGEIITDWTFTDPPLPGSHGVAANDPSFTIQHTFTDVTVFPYGGWQVGGLDQVNVFGHAPQGWLSELEGFSNTPIPNPDEWNVLLFMGDATSGCTHCATWTPVTPTPEPATLFLTAIGAGGIGLLRRKHAQSD